MAPSRTWLYKKCKKLTHAEWEEEDEHSGVECLFWGRSKAFEGASPLSADLPSSLLDCLWSPLLLLTLTGPTPPPLKFHRGSRQSLHSNAPMARGVREMEHAETVCGFHGDRSYCIIPQCLYLEKGSPHNSEHVVLPSQITLTYSWQAQHKTSKQKGGSALYVAFNFVRMTKCHLFRTTLKHSFIAFHRFLSLHCL